MFGDIAALRRHTRSRITERRKDVDADAFLAGPVASGVRRRLTEVCRRATVAITVLVCSGRSGCVFGACAFGARKPRACTFEVGMSAE